MTTIARIAQTFPPLLSSFPAPLPVDPAVSFNPSAPPCPPVSASHSQRHGGSGLRAVLFVIGSADLCVHPWHRVNYSLRRNYCAPVSLVNLLDNLTPGKNESITTVVPGDGFHVRWWSAGKNLGKPFKVTFTAKASLLAMRANIQTPMRKYQRREGSTGFHVRLVCLLWVIIVYAVNLSDLELQIPP